MKKVISIILSLVMLFSLLPMQTFAAEQYTDTAGNWAEGAIDRWSEYGVIEGSNGRFDPNGTLTRAQMAAILSRLLALPEAKSAGFSDVAQTDWFAPYINSCYAAGIMQGSDGKAQPNDPITREQAIVMLSRALGIKPIENADLSGYTDALTVSDWAKGYVAAMAEAGIVKGTSATTVSPMASIDRAATVTILDRAIGTYANVDGAEITAADSGIILIAADNVKVTGAAKNATVIVSPSADGVTVNGVAVAAGTTIAAAEEKQDKPVVSGGGGGSGDPTPSYSDLTISEAKTVTGGTYKDVTITSAVGNGDVTLNNVTIMGKLIVEGGGSNSIHLDGCKVDTIQVNKDTTEQDAQQPRIELNNTPVQTIEAVQPVIIEADTESTVKAVEAKSDVTVKGENTTVQNVTAAADNVKLTVKDAAVEKVTAEKSVTIEATSENSTIKAVEAKSDVTVQGAATKVENVTVPVAAPNKGVKLTVDGAKVETVAAEKPVTINATAGASPIEKIEAKDNITVQGEAAQIEKIEVPTTAKNAPVIDVQAGTVAEVKADKPAEIKSTTGNGAVTNVEANAAVTVASATVTTITVTVQVTVTVTGNQPVEVAVTAPVSVNIAADATNSVAVSTTVNTGVEVKLNEQPVAHVHKWGSGSVTKAASCKEEGSVTYTCSGEGICDMGGEKTETLPKLAHKEVIDDAVAATCTATGLTAGKHCLKCDTVPVKQKTIPALGHDYSVAQHDDAQHWMKCSRCDSTTEKTNHNYGAYTQTKAPTCTEKGSEKAICSICQHEDVREVAALNHSWKTEFTIDTPATCTTAGSKSRHCTRCDAKTDVTEIAALNHNYGEATYTWTKTDNGYVCAGKRVCANDETHMDEATATVTSAVTKAATCTEKGEKTYTATFTKEGFATQTKTEEIAVLGHSFATEWSKDETYHWHVCQREGCDAVNEKEAHSWNAGVVTTPATGTTAGVKTYTCTVCDATKTESVPATDSGIKFVEKYGMLCLSWEDADIDKGMCQLFLSQNGGESWINSVITGSGYIEAAYIPVGEYSAVKVAPYASGSADESAAVIDPAIRFSMTESAARPAAVAAFTYNEEESQRRETDMYDIQVSNVTENVGLRLQVRKSMATYPIASVFFIAKGTTASTTFGCTDMKAAVQSGEYLITEFGAPTISDDGKTASYSFAKRGDWTKCTPETPVSSPKAFVNSYNLNLQLGWDEDPNASRYLVNDVNAGSGTLFRIIDSVTSVTESTKLSYTIKSVNSANEATLWIQADDIIEVVIDPTRVPNVSIVGEESGNYRFRSNNGYTGKYAYAEYAPDGTLIFSGLVAAGGIVQNIAPAEGFTFKVREVNWENGTNLEKLTVTGSGSKSFGFTPYDYSGVRTEVHNEDELSAALNKGGTVVLMNDIDVVNTTASGGGAVTLDLNGHTITLGTNQLGFSNGKVATIVDNSTKKTGKILNASVSVQKGCTVRFEGGEYTYITSQNAEVFLGSIVAHNVQLYDSEVTVEGGTYDGITLTRCNDAKIKRAYSAQEIGNALTLRDSTGVVVEDCEFSGYKVEVDASTAIFRDVTLIGTFNVIYVSGADASLSIESGSYTCNGPGNSQLFCVSGGTLTISGGTFNQDPSDYLAEGSTAAEQGGIWTVSSGNTPAANTDVTTCEALLAALADPAITGINVAESITIPGGKAATELLIAKPVTVAAGKTLTVAGYTGEDAGNVLLWNDLVIKDGGSLTLDSGATLETTESRNGANEMFYRYAGRVYVEKGGTLDVSRGSVTGKSAIYFDYGADNTENLNSSNIIVGETGPDNLGFVVWTEAQLRAAMADAKCTGGIDMESNITLTNDLTVTKYLYVSDFVRLTVPEGKTLTVPEGKEMEASGEMLVYKGKLSNAGKLWAFGTVDIIGGTLENSGTIEGLMTLDDKGNEFCLSTLAIESGATINNFIGEKRGTINDCITVADYYKAGEAVKQCHWHVLEGDHTFDPVFGDGKDNPNFDVMAVGFGTKQVNAALDERTPENEDIYKYEYVMACGTTPWNEQSQTVNTVELGGITVHEFGALLLKDEVFDGTNVYRNKYEISSGKTLKLENGAALVGRSMGDEKVGLEINGEIVNNGGFVGLGDFTLSGTNAPVIVDNAKGLAAALDDGGTIILLPFAEGDENRVEDKWEGQTVYESRYHITDSDANYTISNNTELIGLAEEGLPIAVFFDKGFTVAENTTLKIDGLNIVAVEDSTVNGTIEARNGKVVVEKTEDAAQDTVLTINGKIFVGEGGALATFHKPGNKIVNHGTIENFGELIFDRNSQYSGNEPIEYANYADVARELFYRFHHAGFENLEDVKCYDDAPDLAYLYNSYSDAGEMRDDDPKNSDFDGIAAFAWLIKNGVIADYSGTEEMHELHPYDLVTKTQAAELLNGLGNKILGTTDESYSTISGDGLLSRGELDQAVDALEIAVRKASGENIVQNDAELTTALAKGGKIYLLPFAQGDKTEVHFEENNETSYESQYHVSVTAISKNTELIKLGGGDEPVAVFFDDGFTVAGGVTLKINGLNIVAVKNSTVNGTIEAHNGIVVVQGTKGTTLTISTTGKIVVGQPNEWGALAIFVEGNKIVNYGGIDVLGELIAPKDHSWDEEDDQHGRIYVVEKDGSYINFFPDVMEFGKRLSERVGAYGLDAMTEAEIGDNQERANEWPDLSKENKDRSDGFLFAVKYGLGPHTEKDDQGKDYIVWRPYDKILYGEAINILTNVYKAIAGQDKQFPNTVALGDKNWTPKDTDCISDNDVNDLLDKFVAALPQINDSTTESFIVVKDQEQVISNTTFTNHVTITCDGSKTDDTFGGDIKFNNCAFPEGATVKMTGGVGYNVRLNNNCTGEFTVVDNTTQSVKGVEHTNVNFFGMSGLKINGLTISGEIANVEDNDFNVNVRYDEDGKDDNGKKYISTVEIRNSTENLVTVTGTYTGKLRVAGKLDISGVTMADNNSRIELSNQCDSEIALGSNEILVNDDCGGEYSFTGNGTVTVPNQNEHADITVNDRFLGTPHIFGRDSSGIFLPLKNTEGVELTVQQGHWNEEQQCWTTLECTVQNKNDGGINLQAAEGKNWITDPYQVRVTVKVTKDGDTCTVVYDPMMWKPVQMDEFIEELSRRLGKSYTADDLGIGNATGNLTFGACKTAFTAIWTNFGKTDAIDMNKIITDENYWTELKQWEGSTDEHKADWNPDNWTRRWNDLDYMLNNLTKALGISETESNQ